ncbi:MAG: AMP-binding protein [Mariprofundaceae bacterium]|nr:AMP-binding protein [Mariprofundaceae bacterium]
MNDHSHVLQAIAKHAVNSPDKSALETFDAQITYAALHRQIDDFAKELEATSSQRIAIMMDNAPSVVIADLAVLAAKMLCVPVPLFFSAQQTIHLLRHASIDTVITSMPEAAKKLFALANIEYVSMARLKLVNSNAIAFRLICPKVHPLPKDCQKITYTSGSTGEPKGVCLSQSSMEQVAMSLCEASAASADERHLSMLPFATLLENIGGLYTAMLCGATLIIPPLSECGLEGSSSLNTPRFIAALCRSSATSCILIPQMLQALLIAIDQGLTPPTRLRYVAVGGAPVAPRLLTDAMALGIPAYEGYGLSEAASVVAVNTPIANKIGSVGRLLSHVRIKFSDDGEILVAGSIFLGYLGEKIAQAEYLPTGDIGKIDDAGYLHLQGRKKHIFITAFGRNVSPEWVERELLMEAEIAQVCIFGEAREFNAAVIVVRGAVDSTALKKAVSRANLRLPDYARIHHWVVRETPFTVKNKLWTGTGRARRMQIWKHYQEQLFGKKLS